MDVGFHLPPETGNVDHTAGIMWMTTLSLTFLDGHYISDVVVDEQAAIRRSRILARALDGAFRFLLGSAQSLAREPDLPPRVRGRGEWRRRSTVAGDPIAQSPSTGTRVPPSAGSARPPRCTQLRLLAV